VPIHSRTDRVGETYKRDSASTRKVAHPTQGLIAPAVIQYGSPWQPNPYKYFAFDFTAAALTQTLTLSNDASGDYTVLLDDFRPRTAQQRLSYAALSDDASSGLDGTKTYTHAYRSAPPVGATINGVAFAGIAGGNPSVGGSFSTIGLPRSVQRRQQRDRCQPAVGHTTSSTRRCARALP